MKMTRAARMKVFRLLLIEAVALVEDLISGAYPRINARDWLRSAQRALKVNHE